jgi:hypothetical protein
MASADYTGGRRLRGAAGVYPRASAFDHDFIPSQTSGSDTSYSASVREVDVDGVTYLVDDEEEDQR